MLAPRSIIGNGNKQGPPTLLVTLPQPKGGYMHLALMNCHEHLPAQKLFAKLHVREQLSFRSLSFSIIEVRGLRTASVLLNDINNSFPPFLFFFFLSPHLRIYFLFVRCARLNPSILDIEEFLSIDPAIVRDIGYCCSPMCSRLSQDRNVSVRYVARTMHRQSRLSTTFLPFRLPRSCTFSRTSIIEPSVSSLPPNPFFAQRTVSFAYETASWRYFVSKIFSRRQERDRKSEKNERKTQLPRLGGDFSMGKFECYCIYLHYILLQFDLSSALSRGRKSRHSGLAL